MKDYSTYNPTNPVDPSVGFMSYNVVQRAIDLIPEQFKDKPMVNAMVEAFAAGVQKIENLLSDILIESELGQAEGAQLDLLGNLFGVRRGGRDDAAYRAAISTQIVVITSDGSPNEIISLASILGNTPTVRYFEHYPADLAVSIEANPIGAGEPNDLDRLPTNVADLLQKASPAGVGEVMVFVHYPGQAVFSELQAEDGTIQVNSDYPETGNFELYDLTDHGGNQIVYKAKAKVDDYSSLGILSEIIPQDGEVVTIAGDEAWVESSDADQYVLIYQNNLELAQSGILAEVYISGK